MEIGSTVFLAALGLIGFWIVTQRLSLLEERVRQVPSPDDLGARVAPLEERLEGMTRVEDRLRAIDGTLQALASRPADDGQQERWRESLAALEGSFAELRQQVEKLRLGDSQNASTTAAVDPLSEHLIRFLEREGYGGIRVLADLEAADPLDEHRVPVEARRSGVSYKGLVTLSDGRVSGVALKPSSEAFP